MCQNLDFWLFRSNIFCVWVNRIVKILVFPVKIVQFFFGKKNSFPCNKYHLQPTLTSNTSWCTAIVRRSHNVAVKQVACYWRPPVVLIIINGRDVNGSVANSIFHLPAHFATVKNDDLESWLTSLRQIVRLSSHNYGNVYWQVKKKSIFCQNFGI